MTFDELWRMNLADDDALMSSVEPAEDIELFQDPVLEGPILDDPDETEMNRFLDWLETRFL
jgi:hypothetical protein